MGSSEQRSKYANIILDETVVSRIRNSFTTMVGEKQKVFTEIIRNALEKLRGETSRQGFIHNLLVLLSGARLGRPFYLC